MIYFDNAATTKYKPDEVYEAANYYLKEIGVSPGRGSYSLGIEASRMLYKSRCSLGRYFGLTRPERVVFTKNSTEAINLFLNGFLQTGDHVIISCYEHNAVLRPIQNLKNQGRIEYSVIRREDLDLPSEELFARYVQKNTRLLVTTLASNLTGRIVFREDLFKYFHEKEIVTFLDSSQGAGKIPLDMATQSIDFLAFTGHKDLLGIPGVGGLCCESKEKFIPLIQGGTGIHGEEYVNPDIFPEGYEAGTLNMPAIWALQAGVNYLRQHRQEIWQTEHMLIELILDELGHFNDIVVYDPDVSRVSTCCFTLKDQSSDRTVAFLDKNGVCVRGGIHCAILAHQAIGTVETGAVRISLGYRNSQTEVDRFIKILKER